MPKVFIMNQVLSRSLSFLVFMHVLYMHHTYTATPPISQLHISIHTHPNHTSDYITIIAHGYTPYRTQYGSRTTKRLLKYNNVHTDIISFEYSDIPHTATLAQTDDIQRLATVVDHTQKLYPNKKMILHGISRGASTVVAYYKTYPCENIAAVIAESPFARIPDVTDHLTTLSRLGQLTSRDLVLELFQKIHPRYNPHHPHPIDDMTSVHKDIPVFFTCTTTDHLVPHWSTYNLAHAVAQGNPHVYLLKINTGLHGHLSRIQDVQQTLNAFLQRYHLPHDPQLAQAGYQSLCKSSMKSAV